MSSTRPHAEEPEVCRTPKTTQSCLCLSFSVMSVGHKSHDPCFRVFLKEARVMTFVAHCTVRFVCSVSFSFLIARN